MYNSRKKLLEDIPEEMTSIWSCTSDSCNGWMRDNFAFSNEPDCPQCGSEMTKGEKKLAVLVNTSPSQAKE
mgnify:CR=1 FL=1